METCVDDNALIEIHLEFRTSWWAKAVSRRTLEFTSDKPSLGRSHMEKVETLLTGFACSVIDLGNLRGVG